MASPWGWVSRSVARRVAIVSGLVTVVVAVLLGWLAVPLLRPYLTAGLAGKLLQVIVVAGLATVLIIVGATIVIVDQTVGKQLRGLTDKIEAAKDGLYLKRTGSDRHDEIGELARAFDRLAAHITSLAAEIIDHDRELALTRRESRMKDVLALLLELTQEVGSATDFERLLQRIPSAVGPALDFEEVAILTAEDDDCLVVRATYGFPPEDNVRGLEFHIGEGISGEVVRRDEAIVIADTASDPRYLHYKGRHMKDGSFMSAPMKVQGRLVGLFSVLRSEPGGFTDDERHLCHTIGSYVGLAIAHAQTSLHLVDMSVTDVLTGLPNRRRLLERAESEVARSERTGSPLCALMIDIDHFKAINDRYGHAAGDEILSALADRLTDELRQNDLVARHGGEEFAVLLPDTQRAEAVTTAEKLCQAAHELHTPDGTLAVSIGVAAYPDDATSATELLDAADRALYAAKRQGRDRVVTYSRRLGTRGEALASS